jgi:sterol desaturase/sphingolipid hydroxylase (fatty acid hydroxylase superfamily)
MHALASVAPRRGGGQAPRRARLAELSPDPGGFLPTVHLHNLHHALDRHHQDSNYSGQTPVWDILFGTFSHPSHCELGPLGIEDSPVPAGFLAQVLFPFRAQRGRPREGSSVEEA